jgi:hypothetical protein
VIEDSPSYQGIFDDMARALKPRGVVDTSELHTTALVDHVFVDNSGADQLSVLMRDQYPRIGSLKNSLKNHPTRFSMTLRDLRNEPLLEEIVRVRDVAFAPKHMVSMEDVFYSRRAL